MNVIRSVVTSLPVFRDESEVLRAVEAVTAFEKHLVANHSAVVKEGETAPVEDVRQRRAPNAPAPTATVAGEPIDYARLAAAIVAAQASQERQNAQPVQSITDVPERPAAPAVSAEPADPPQADGDSFYGGNGQ